jgi:hypothetical protein
MIHEIGVELRASLVTVLCPLPVVDGPEQSDAASFGRERIVIGYADEPGQVVAPRSQRKNPLHLFDRMIPAQLDVYARAPDAGPTSFEHARRAHHVMDLVLVHLDKVCRTRKEPLEIGSVTPLVPEAFADVKRPGGYALRLQFSVRRAVLGVTWASVAATEATLASGTVVSTTQVSRVGDSTPDNETACGA